MKWRKLNNVIHRDVGYVCVGLTLVYAISGVAVNHIRDWNPNFRITAHERNIGPVAAPDPTAAATVADILRRLGINGPAVNTFRPDPETLRIFLENGTVDVWLPDGRVVVETVAPRTGLREMNSLHLNHPRRLWTYMADVYAVALIVLAVTGMFVIKGKKGMAGRGAWLTAAGVAIPIVFLLWYL